MACNPSVQTRLRTRQRDGGFTLLELLVASSVLLILLAILFQITAQVGNVWRDSSDRSGAYKNARAAFDAVTRTLSQASLNTYLDYVDAAGQYRYANPGSFVPDRFARASELHFLSGPTADLFPGANTTRNPGHTVVFQAPLGVTDDANLRALDQALNGISFYVEYASLDEAGLLPSWLSGMFGSDYRYQLRQFILPTKQNTVYQSTQLDSYSLNWLDAMNPGTGTEDPGILAENVSLLLLRPRLSSRDEIAVASQLGGDALANPGSILSPNYHYDSRAWESGYPAGQGVLAAPNSTARAEAMRNQLPPMVDVVMVALEGRSVQRLDLTSPAPPSEIRPPTGLFTNSAQMEDDLQTYLAQLDNANVGYRVFRSSVPIQAARWSN